MRSQMRYLLILAALVLAGCATSSGRPPPPCPTITVQNDNYWDVTVYQLEPKRRIGRAGGLQTTVLRACSMGRRPADFLIEGQANSFDLTLRGESRYLDLNAEVGIIVGPTPNLSFIIGDG